MNELPQTSQAQPRGALCVILALDSEDHRTQRCLESVRAHTPAGITVTAVEPTTKAVNAEIERVSEADVAILEDPCTVFDGWLDGLRGAA